MPIYANADQLYDCFQTLFDQLRSDYPQAIKPLANSRLRIRFRCTDPQAQVFINGRSKPVSTAFGPNNDKPGIDVQLTADTLHHVLTGELGLRKALGSGKLRTKGPMLKALAMAELFRTSQRIYPQIVRDKGILL